MVANRETYILISDEGLFPAEFIYPSDDLFPEDPSLRQVSNIVAGSLQLDEIIAERVPQFGQMFATKFECTVYLEEDLAGKFIHVYQVVNGVSKDVFAGKIDSCKLDKVGTDRKLIAYDLAYEKGQQNVASWWERFWANRTSATIGELRTSLLNAFSIVFENVELPNDNLVVHKNVTLTSCTLTAMLRMICELNYCFPHMGRDGLMQFIMLNTEPENIQDVTGEYEGLNSDFEDFVTAPITGVQFFDSGSELKFTYGQTDNAYPIKQNIFLYDQPTSVLETIGAEVLDYLSDFSYTPSKVKMIIGSMDINVGDFIHTENGDFYVMENSYSGSQFIEQTIKAEGVELLYGGTQNFDYNEIILSEKIARVRQTVEAFEVEYADFKEQTEANFSVTADSITAEVNRARNSESALSSQIQQTAESISLSVSNSSTSSTIKLLLGQTELSSNVIQMTGLVKFTDLSTAGSTTINGSNITTGSISANRIQGGKLRISDDGHDTDAIIVRKTSASVPERIFIDANDGILVRHSSGNDGIKINEDKITIMTSRIVIDGSGSTGNISCSGAMSCKTLSASSDISASGKVTCKTLTVNGAGYSAQSVTNVRVGGANGSLPSLYEVKAFDIDSTTNLYAVSGSSAPSMRGNSSNGYNFSSSPTWKKISLKQVSYSTKIYGFGGSNLSINNKTVLAH